MTTQQAQQTLKAILIIVSLITTVLWIATVTLATVLKAVSTATVSLADSLESPTEATTEPVAPNPANLLPPAQTDSETNGDTDIDIDVEAVPTDVLVSVLADYGIPTTAKNGRRLSRAAIIARVKKLQA